MLGMHARVNRWMRLILIALPFAVLITVYVVASDIRHAENPQDKLLPGAGKMVNAVERMAFTKDKRSGDYLLWADTLASLRRIAIGVGLSAVIGLLLGIHMGLLPVMRCTLLSFVTFISNIPPLAILPIIFIAFGIGELGKVMLIFLGTFTVITRDVYLTVRAIPKEQIVKALTLGASQFGVAYRVVLPQVMPRLLDTVRLTLGAAWLFLIASEAIASSNGLGYRIFVVRRYLAMDIIIPYVLWITLLAYLMDLGLRVWVKLRHPWYAESKQGA